MLRLAIGLLVVICAMPLAAQKLGEKAASQLTATKIEPPSWWVGMKWNQLEGASFAFRDDALEITNTKVVSGGKYAFLDFAVPADIKPGVYQLEISRGDVSCELSFPIRTRRNDVKAHRGFGPEDLIYLITPDRFANGDPTNDRVDDPVAGMLDEYDPGKNEMRHGGDLQGLIDHLDYISELGVTAIWLNPVLENRGKQSYHGYAATDLYRIDPRFGTNELYRTFVEEAHRRDLKVIFDHISNHIGVKHPWLTDLPANDWLNGTLKDHLTNKHYLLSISDPHSDKAAQSMLKTFWFVDVMPDLNQRNPELATYMIQNSIWWIEFSGLDGIREDTYPYADQEFLTRWAKAIRDEYPNFNIVGEIWAIHPSYIALFQEGSKLPGKIETNLPSMMDFPLMQIWRRFLMGDAKLRDVHQVYAQDFLYADPNNLVVFLDNHDISRGIFCAEGDVKRFKLALTVLLGARGIPQVLYGSEIQMMGGESHVELRADFPGGFPNSKSDAFSKSGRTATQNAMFDFCQKLFTLRKQHPALSLGEMIHYPPKWFDDTYKILKRHDQETILIVANGNDESKDVELSELEHHVSGSSKIRDLLTGEEFNWSPGQKVEVAAMTARLLQFLEAESEE